MSVEDVDTETVVSAELKVALEEASSWNSESEVSVTNDTVEEAEEAEDERVTGFLAGQARGLERRESVSEPV